MERELEVGLSFGREGEKEERVGDESQLVVRFDIRWARPTGALEPKAPVREAQVL